MKYPFFFVHITTKYLLGPKHVSSCLVFGNNHYRAEKNCSYVVARMLQASCGRSGKQHQEHTSPEPPTSIIFRPSWLSACWIQFETIRNWPLVVSKSDRDCIAGSLIGRTDEIGRKSWQITEPLLFSEQQELLCSLCEVRNTATTGHDVSVQCAKLKTSSANAAAGLRVLQISLECGAAVESLSRPLGRSTTDQKVTAFFNRSKIALGRFAVQAVHL